MDGRVHVTLGETQYVVVPQRIGYIMNQLGPDLSAVLEVASEGEESDSTGITLGKQAYGIISKLIPAFDMPEWKFMGFGSEEAYASKTYVADSDVSPDMPQVTNAIKMAAKVNVGEGLDFLRDTVGPEILRKMLALAIARMAEPSENDSDSQPSLPQPNGASDPTNSGTTAPTSPPSEGSPSPA
jgi:hypothetical protein